MNVSLKPIFENSIGGIISGVVISFLLPTASVIQIQSQTTSSWTTIFLNPTFIASVIVSIFLVILFQFCRKIFHENKMLKDKADSLEMGCIKALEKTEVLGVIGHYRNKALFIRSFDNVEFFRVPNETDDEFLARLPSGGLFHNHLFEEYTQVRKYLEKNMKNKTGLELDTMLKRYYPESFFTQS
jgi:hypothetical protein